MARFAVLGAGRVGAVVAADLAREHEVLVVDARPEALERAQEAAPGRIATRRLQVGAPGVLESLADEADVLVGALASRVAHESLRRLLGRGARVIDVSFMAEDALALDGLARETGAVAWVDFGVAPGMSHLLAAHAAAGLERAERVEILVGGLPREPRPPFRYKAGFAPADVLEEYLRPARVVERGRVVERPALAERELVDFEGLGALEAALTDGLRSLVHAPLAPEMVEKTLRWPGHYELMLALREAGFLSAEPLDLGGGRAVRPLELAARLLEEAWSFAPGEEDLTVMRITVEGRRGGRSLRLVHEVLVGQDRERATTSMARATATPCALAARRLAEERDPEPGVHPPEELAALPGFVEWLLAEHERRGIRYRLREEQLG
jgi:saccharopine dehydrogenase-like NADP-dependent oxidoreductase